ncbi:MAG: YraN family protein [Phycisphaerales bacterium]|nr:MAG: YraN family protein [Phycisphaerales bacterium]
MLQTADVGILGERAARQFLRRLGYRILARNHRSSAGEIDLIAMDGDVVVFAEVKTRTSRSGADPEANIAAGQIGRISRAAQRFLLSSGAGDWPARLDVLTVMLAPDGPPKVEHFKSAFPLGGRR